MSDDRAVSAPRSRRSKRLVVAVAAAVLAIAAIAAAVPIEIRNSAAFGASSTFDPRRSIAVRGGRITPNYDGFNRLDLDLRGYTETTRYDLTIHVRPAGGEAPDVRTIPLSLDGETIWHEKAAFADPYLTLRFPAIADSAGMTYYVSVEAGPRNRDDVWTLWRIKSFSRVRSYTVLGALVDTPPEPLAGVGGVVLILLMGGTVGSAAWLVAATACLHAGRPNRGAAGATSDAVARAKG